MTSTTDLRTFHQSSADFATMERNLLEAGLLDFGTKPLVLVDMDGTLADHHGLREPHDLNVDVDRPNPVVVDWVRALSAAGNTIVELSARHLRTGKATATWLQWHDVPFDHLLMRTHFNLPDVAVKQEMLDLMFRCGVTKEQILFALDDRPAVVNGVWRKNGIKVFPVRGTNVHRASCTFTSATKFDVCPDCGALGDF